MAYDLNSEGFKKASNTALMKNISEKVKDAIYKKFTMANPSKSASETYEWIGDLPGMNEWLDDRQIKGLEKNSYTLKNKQWESTLGFFKKNLENDPDIVKARIPTLAESVVDHPTSLLFEVLLANEICYDGQPFFDDSHPFLDKNDKESTYDNKLTGTGTTVAQIQADFASMQATFQSYKKRNGEPVFASLDKITIVHSPALNVNMRTAFGADAISSTTNVFKGLAEPISSGFLTGNSWYGFILTKSIKPFIFQLREKVTSKWDKSEEFKKGKWFFGVDGQYNIGYGFPQLGIKIVNS